MAYIDKDFASVDTKIQVKIRDKFYKGEVKKFPFVAISTKKTKIKSC